MPLTSLQAESHIVDSAYFRFGMSFPQKRESHKTDAESSTRDSAGKEIKTRIENGHSDIQLSTLYKLIEFGLGRKINLTIQ